MILRDLIAIKAKTTSPEAKIESMKVIHALNDPKWGNSSSLFIDNGLKQDISDNIDNADDQRSRFYLMQDFQKTPYMISGSSVERSDLYLMVPGCASGQTIQTGYFYDSCLILFAGRAVILY